MYIERVVIRGGGRGGGVSYSKLDVLRGERDFGETVCLLGESLLCVRCDVVIDFIQ